MKTLIARYLRRAADRLDPPLTAPTWTVYTDVVVSGQTVGPTIWPQDGTFTNPDGSSWSYTITNGAAA